MLRLSGGNVSTQVMPNTNQKQQYLLTCALDTSCIFRSIIQYLGNKNDAIFSCFFNFTF